MRAALGNVLYLTVDSILVAVELSLGVWNTFVFPALDVLRNAARQFAKSEYFTILLNLIIVVLQ